MSLLKKEWNDELNRHTLLNPQLEEDLSRLFTYAKEQEAVFAGKKKLFNFTSLEATALKQREQTGYFNAAIQNKDAQKFSLKPNVDRNLDLDTTNYPGDFQYAAARAKGVANWEESDAAYKTQRKRAALLDNLRPGSGPPIPDVAEKKNTGFTGIMPKGCPTDFNYLRRLAFLSWKNRPGQRSLGLADSITQPLSLERHSSRIETPKSHKQVVFPAFRMCVAGDNKMAESVIKALPNKQPIPVIDNSERHDPAQGRIDQYLKVAYSNGQNGAVVYQNDINAGVRQHPFCRVYYYQR